MGQPAARAGDPIAHTSATGAITEGSANVLIARQPASRVGDKVQHASAVEVIMEGEPSILINGRRAARVGDKVTCSGMIIAGCTSVHLGTNAVGDCVAAAGDAGAVTVSG